MPVHDNLHGCSVTAVTLQRLGSQQKRNRNHSRCMMKQIIKHAVAKAVGKNIYMHAASSYSTENPEENAVRHGFAMQLDKNSQNFLTQSLKIFILG